MLSRAHVIFTGKVQGVFFRANTERKAKELRINGWVRNLRNRNVEAVFEGPKDSIEKLLDWLSHHQPHAKVDDARVNWEEYKSEFNDFEIRYGY